MTPAFDFDWLIVLTTIGSARYRESSEAEAHAIAAFLEAYPWPNPEDSRVKSYLPIEKVFEHGFYPLQGGVRFNQSGTEQVIVFSQWTEILPTDQIAALEVKYDPKTLQIITADDVDEK